MYSSWKKYIFWRLKILLCLNKYCEDIKMTTKSHVQACFETSLEIAIFGGE